MEILEKIGINEGISEAEMYVGVVPSPEVVYNLPVSPDIVLQETKDEVCLPNPSLHPYRWRYYNDNRCWVITGGEQSETLSVNDTLRVQPTYSLRGKREPQTSTLLFGSLPSHRESTVHRPRPDPTSTHGVGPSVALGDMTRPPSSNRLVHN